jgi:hypothetical protein
LLAGTLPLTQYLFFRGNDNEQKRGGGHPRALNAGKFTNAELHNFKFPLAPAGDLICLELAMSLHLTSVGIIDKVQINSRVLLSVFIFTVCNFWIPILKSYRKKTSMKILDTLTDKKDFQTFSS